VVDSQS